MTITKTVKTTKTELLAKIEDAAVVIEKLTRKLAAAKPAAKPAAAKHATRGGRLIEAERQVKAARPKDARCVWQDMDKAK
jgi:hypothetical protein